MSISCNICGGPKDKGPAPGLNTCGFCIHIIVSRSEWIAQTESILSSIRDAKIPRDRLAEHLSEDEIIIPQLAEHVWKWHSRNIGRFDLRFEFLESLDIEPINDVLQYIRALFESIRFERLLDDQVSEREISRYLDDNQRVIQSATAYSQGEAAYCFREFQFGSDFVGDFLIVTPRRSVAPLINLVELEPVEDMLFTKKGLPSHRLVTAMNQVKQWRSWIRQNPKLFRDEILKRSKRALDPADLDRWIRYEEIQMQAFIFIGRRSAIKGEDYRNLWASNEDRITIHTYDSILEWITHNDMDTLRYEAELQTREVVRRHRLDNRVPRKSIKELF